MIYSINFMACAVLILATSIWAAVLYRNFSKTIEEEEFEENE
jgi:hypothetical protein